jgi:hypothetical protein
MTDSLGRITAIFNSLDASPRWAEARNRWPEGTEGPAISSGNVNNINLITIFIVLILVICC